MVNGSQQHRRERGDNKVDFNKGGRSSDDNDSSREEDWQEVDIAGERSDSDVYNSEKRGRQRRGSQMHEDRLFFGYVGSVRCSKSSLGDQRYSDSN